MTPKREDTQCGEKKKWSFKVPAPSKLHWGEKTTTNLIGGMALYTGKGKN